MEVGIFCGFSSATPPAMMAAQVKAIEERGFHCIWVPEHVVLFEEYSSQYPYSEDGRIPGFGNGIMEPFTALSFAAAHTSTIRLGTSICLITQRNPVYTAKQVADLDFLSGGRFNFGVGLGWLKEEFEALNTPWERRGQRARDHLGVMQALWMQETSSYTSDLYTLPPCVQYPKPVQTPHPPVFFGGEGLPALRRVAEIGQGWLGAGLEPDEVAAKLPLLNDLLATAGRARDDILVYTMPNRAAQPDDFARYADLGVDQVIFMVGGRDIDGYLRRLDRMANIAL
tara:strand:- start:956 stop:1807 length:852 start_codon:yes stop_codon:yes gene_type:complete